MMVRSFFILRESALLSCIRRRCFSILVSAYKSHLMISGIRKIPWYKMILTNGKYVLLYETEDEHKFALLLEVSMVKEDKLKALDAALVQIEKNYGKGAVMKLGIQAST